MNDAGTLQEVRAFIALCDDVRRRSGRTVTFILIHHENKGGKVSGAWEGAGDTLLHVSGMGHGRTRLHIQKARWSSTWHAQTLELCWLDGEGFEVDVKPEVSDEDLAERILQAVNAEAGISASKLEKAIEGVSHERFRTWRDRLLLEGRIVNVVRRGDTLSVLDHVEPRQRTHLHLADDPIVRQLRPNSGADGAQTVPPGGAP